jgi:hypothetical protein
MIPTPSLSEDCTMNRLLAAVSLALMAGNSLAADSKPNTLAPKEIAEGWILLFDGETPFGWKSDKAWKAADGVLTPADGKPTSLVTTSAFPSFELSLEYEVRALEPKPLIRFGCGADGKAIPTRSTDIPLAFDPKNQQPGWVRFTLNVTEEGADQIAKWTFETKAVTAMGNGRTQNYRAQGHIVFEGNVALRNVRLRPLGAKPLFNGKDLTGWKEFPGKKSKFIVNDKGELNVKDGPGDLRTVGEYDDFVLQLECISNGKALNSGIFFRCIPEQYQNGYEAQIQNGYKDGDRTKPVDFGTGAIYRRVPARKVVSNDHEWFTMTVLARGNHIATWVNGYQTVDWTDDRPADINPRKGSKTGKGHISIQGHDPTTDLSFRNLRIVEIPKKN